MKFKKSKSFKDLKDLMDDPDIIPASPGGLQVIGRLEADEYWEWRTTIEELMHHKTKVSLAEKEVRIKELETALIRRDLYNIKNETETIQLGYNDLKSKLEKRHKISLNNTTIEPSNFEIKLLEAKDREV